MPNQLQVTQCIIWKQRQQVSWKSMVYIMMGRMQLQLIFHVTLFILLLFHRVAQPVVIYMVCHFTMEVTEHQTI